MYDLLKKVPENQVFADPDIKENLMLQEAFSRYAFGKDNLDYFSMSLYRRYVNRKIFATVVKFCMILGVTQLFWMPWKAVLMFVMK